MTALKRQRPIDVIREKLETDTERWLSPYEHARDRGDWRATEALLDRVLGKPVQVTATVTHPGQHLMDMTPQALEALAAALDEQIASDTGTRELEP
jgi:hypothetical protein